MHAYDSEDGAFADASTAIRLEGPDDNARSDWADFDDKPAVEQLLRDGLDLYAQGVAVYTRVRTDVVKRLEVERDRPAKDEPDKAH